MKKPYHFALALSAVLLLSGCAATHQRSSSGYDASLIDPFIRIGTTTSAEVRSLLGTPTLQAKTADGSLVYAFALVGHNFGQSMGRNSLRGLAMGFAVKSNEYTVKIVHFKFDQAGRVSGYEKSGVSYLQKHRLDFWNVCERELSPAEINSPINYPHSEVCTVYAEEIAAKTGVKPEEVDIDKEFDFCGYDCQTQRSTAKLFGPLTDMTTLVSSEPGDGEKFNVVFPAAK